MIKTYNITKTVYKVGQLISWIRSGELDLNPNFQRRSVWSKGAKSFLIDTIIKGLPIPVLLFREKRTELGSLKSVNEVIDGQQRVRTVISYVAPDLLPKYDVQKDLFTILPSHNKQLSRKSFEELSPDVRQRILDYQFAVHIFPSEISDQEIYEMFSRMNSTGYKLNAQELRNSKYFGILKTLVYNLGSQQLQRWRDWGIFSEDNIARMQEIELVSEFVLMMFNGMTTKKQKDLDQLYENKDEVFPEKKEVERRFQIIMDSINDLLGKDIRGTSFTRRTFFYVLFAYIYSIQFGLKSSLKKMTPANLSPPIAKRIRNLMNEITGEDAPEEILEIAGRRTTDLKTRKRIFKYLKTGK